MRSLVLLAALLWALPEAAFGQTELVTGFRGYPWGTPVSAIPEVAGTEKVGEKEGLHIYAAPVRVAEQEALAGFYFHPETGALLEGAYAFALTLDRCLPTWAILTEGIEAEQPELVREARVPRRTTADDFRVYEHDCEFFVYNSHVETWTATYRNPRPPDDRILLRVRTTERTPRLTVLYRGAAGQAWADSVAARGRPEGGAPGPPAPPGPRR